MQFEKKNWAKPDRVSRWGKFTHAQIENGNNLRGESEHDRQNNIQI